MVPHTRILVKIRWKYAATATHPFGNRVVATGGNPRIHLSVKRSKQAMRFLHPARRTACRRRRMCTARIVSDPGSSCVLVGRSTELKGIASTSKSGLHISRKPSSRSGHLLEGCGEFVEVTREISVLENVVIRGTREARHS